MYVTLAAMISVKRWKFVTGISVRDRLYRRETPELRPEMSRELQNPKIRCDSAKKNQAESNYVN